MPSPKTIQRYTIPADAPACRLCQEPIWLIGNSPKRHLRRMLAMGLCAPCLDREERLTERVTDAEGCDWFEGQSQRENRSGWTERELETLVNEEDIHDLEELLWKRYD